MLAATLYALLFVPVYTLVGWFEPMPLFFLLLGLELLLVRAEWGWVASAVVVGLGFLTKLTPAVLVPVAVWWLAGDNSSRRRENARLTLYRRGRGARREYGFTTGLRTREHRGDREGSGEGVLRWLPVARLRWAALWKLVSWWSWWGWGIRLWRPTRNSP